MHDGMQYDPIKGQGQAHQPLKVVNPSIFKSCFLRRLQWELLTYRAGFLIFGLVFVSHDFEVGTNVSCEESSVSPRTGLIKKLLLRFLGDG